MWRVVLLMGAVMALLPTTASATLVDTSIAAGQFPSPAVTGPLEPPKRAPRLEVRASPSTNPVNLRVSVYCFREGISRSRDYVLWRRRATLSHRVRLTVRRADYCSVTASAEYSEVLTTGRLSLKLYS